MQFALSQLTVPLEYIDIFKNQCLLRLTDSCLALCYSNNSLHCAVLQQPYSFACIVLCTVAIY